jgi:hypothetical protein
MTFECLTILNYGFGTKKRAFVLLVQFSRFINQKWSNYFMSVHFRTRTLRKVRNITDLNSLRTLTFPRKN